MRRYIGALALGALGGMATSVWANDIPVPSGQPLSFLQFISEDDGALVRFRFLAPQIGTGYDYMTVFPDFQVLCDQQVVPVLDQNGLTPTRIVLSMSAAEVEFGQDDPDVLQFFEIFRPENGICIWEEF
ncbi:DUF6497 family protein [Pseudooctadecabacter jejudonensis]|uniref:DUF6497 family protein n=1 Tax=Pseudooctadecabacter jejudonensis TaxID=1391910 RepID=UPI00117ADCA6|nr:DUF6497 family protein [Pseudooctadecabacter jejudonensis]